MGSDYSHHTVRVIHEGKLYRVDSSGNPTEISKEQNWQVHPDYYNARYVQQQDCEIESCCECSYPVFWSWRNVHGAGGTTVRDWRAVTCLVEDSGREVFKCPNCRFPLLVEEESWTEGCNEEEETDDDWFDWEEIPDTCKGCAYYNTNSRISCAVHPSGAESEMCPDWSPER